MWPIYTPVFYFTILSIPAFDWGGLLGGIIGAIGAFGSAYLIHFLQNRSRQRRESIQIRIKASRVIRDSLNVLNSLPLSAQQMLYISERVFVPVEDILPAAAENDKKLFAIMSKLVRRLGEIVSEHGTTTPQCILDFTNELKDALDRVALLNREYL